MSVRASFALAGPRLIALHAPRRPRDAPDRQAHSEPTPRLVDHQPTPATRPARSSNHKTSTHPKRRWADHRTPTTPADRARKPPNVPRYETPPTTQLAPQSRPTGQTPRRQADENPSGAPTARSRYRVTTTPPPNNQQSLHRNADQPAALLSRPPAHAPTAEAAPPVAPRPPAAHAAPEPRSHSPAYESHRRGADPTSDA